MLRLLVAFVTLIIVVLIVTQIVLSTAIPKEIVIAQVQKIMGLRVTAAEVSTGWFGHTTLRDVTVSLPLAEHAFLEMPELRVTHTSLPVLLATQSIDITALELDHPQIHVTQDRQGRWNLQDVAQILARIGGNGQPASDQKSSPIVLPRVDLRDGQIDITDNAGRQANLGPLEIIGQPANALVWQYDASCDSAAGTHITLVGRVAPNDNFSHEVDFKVSDLAPLVKPWLADFDANAVAKGTWRGAQKGDGVAGRLHLDGVGYQGASANGNIDIIASAARATANISRVTLQTGQSRENSLIVTGGSISVDQSSATANALEISALNGRAIASGSFSFADQSGNLHAEWNNLAPIAALTSSGSVDANFSSNWPDQRAIQVNLHTSGSAAGNHYNAVVALTGGGKTWDTASFILAAPTLRWSGKRSVVLDHLTAHLATTPGQITLSDVDLPGSTTVAGGGALRFDPRKLTNANWWLYLQGTNWTNPYAPGAALTFGLNAWGNPEQVRLEQAFGIVGRIYAGMNGYYRFAQPKPVDVLLNICELPAPIGNGPDIIRGYLRGDGVLSGTIKPLALDATGQLRGDQIVFQNRPPQQIAVKCTASVRNNLLLFDTEELSLFGGQWSMHAQIPARQKIHGEAPDVTLRVHDLPLANIADLIHQKDVAGTAAGSVEFDIDQVALGQITGTGHFDATNVRARQFNADSLAADLSVHDGVAELSPIDIRLARGSATAKLSTRLNNPKQLTASLDATDWPIDGGPIHAIVSANTQNLLVDTSTQTASGHVTFNTSAQFQDRPLLTANGSVGVSGRVLILQNLNAKILDGDASGSGTIDIDHPLTARGTFRWDDLDLSKLAGYDPIYQTANGFLTGRADLAPTNDPRALAPLMLDIACVGQSTRFRSVRFTQLHLPIFFDTKRVVSSGGQINLGGGTIGLYARASLHDQNILSTQIQAKLNSLDLQQLIHAADKTEADKIKAYPGRLSGTISVVGDPRDKLQLFGQASLQIHDSDLANFGPFAVLYDTMHLGGNAGKPIGEGTLEARYDNDNLIISSLRYFNRGVDAYGLATIGKVSKYPACPLSGEVVGTLAPLRNIKLPFFADADKIFSVLQANLTSIVISGTLANGGTYLPESAAAIGSAMRNFLLGDVTTQSK
jgi:hypothetical protein